MHIRGTKYWKKDHRKHHHQGCIIKSKSWGTYKKALTKIKGQKKEAYKELKYEFVFYSQNGEL